MERVVVLNLNSQGLIIIINAWYLAVSLPVGGRTSVPSSLTNPWRGPSYASGRATALCASYLLELLI